MITSHFLVVLVVGILSEGLGKDISYEDAPWQASLKVNREHICSGTFYNERIIITAAHCFYKRIGIMFYRLLRPNEIYIVGGNIHKRSGERVGSAVMIVHHEKFTMSSSLMKHDIGIVKTDYSHTIKSSLSLAIMNPHPGTSVLSTGWGLIVNPSLDYIYPEKLQAGHIKVEESFVCQAFVPWMTKDLICGRMPRNEECWLDPGGPLILGNQLVGVFSGGYANCRGAVFFTSVSYYNSWLRKAIDDAKN